MGAVGGVQRLLKHLLVVDTPTACCGMGRGSCTHRTLWFVLDQPATSLGHQGGLAFVPKRGYPQDPRRLACFLSPPLTRRGVVRVQPAGSVSQSSGSVSCCLVLGGPSIATQHTVTTQRPSGPKIWRGRARSRLLVVLSNPCLPVSGPSSRTEPRRAETFSGLKHCV